MLLAGLAGATASTTVATVMGFDGNAESLRCTTAADAFSDLPLALPSDLMFGGWDFCGDTLDEVCSRHGIVGDLDETTKSRLAKIRPLPGIRTKLDIPIEENHTNLAPFDGVFAAIDHVIKDIETFWSTAGVDTVVVVYLGSPHAEYVDDPLSMPGSWDDLRDMGGDVPSSLVYALGAVQACAHFVDFTPGRCLESVLLRRLSGERSVQLAGRDGSTGQTMLKLTLAELFSSRGMKVKGWYSTNVIGNHDGYVLSMPQHATVKIADKRDGLARLLGYSDFDHHVTIDYVPQWGDRKESWDAMILEGWAGSSLDVRVDWRGMDSMLAAGMIFDLIRLLEFGERNRLSGVRPELGYFFKRPIEREGKSPSSLLTELVQFYTSSGKA